MRSRWGASSHRPKRAAASSLPLGSVYWTYADNGAIEGVTASWAGSVGYARDPSTGLVNSVTTSAGTAATVTSRDVMGLPGRATRSAPVARLAVSRPTRPAGARSPGPEPRGRARREGRPEAILLAGGARIDTAWDTLGRVTGREVGNGLGDTQSRQYYYDNRGRADCQEVYSGGTLSETIEYAYDEPGWLVEEARAPASGTSTASYGYDLGGNRTGRVVVQDDGTGSPVTTSTSYTIGTGNRVTGVDGAPTSRCAMSRRLACVRPKPSILRRGLLLRAAATVEK